MSSGGGDIDHKKNVTSWLLSLSQEDLCVVLTDYNKDECEKLRAMYTRCKNQGHGFFYPRDDDFGFPPNLHGFDFLEQELNKHVIKKADTNNPLRNLRFETRSSSHLSSLGIYFFPKIVEEAEQNDCISTADLLGLLSTLTQGGFLSVMCNLVWESEVKEYRSETPGWFLARGHFTLGEYIAALFEKLIWTRYFKDHDIEPTASESRRGKRDNKTPLCIVLDSRKQRLKTFWSGLSSGERERYALVKMGNVLNAVLASLRESSEIEVNYMEQLDDLLNVLRSTMSPSAGSSPAGSSTTTNTTSSSSDDLSSIKSIFEDALVQDPVKFVEFLCFSPIDRAGTIIDMIMRQIGTHLQNYCIERVAMDLISSEERVKKKTSGGSGGSTPVKKKKKKGSSTSLSSSSSRDSSGEQQQQQPQQTKRKKKTKKKTTTKATRSSSKTEDNASSNSDTEKETIQTRPRRHSLPMEVESVKVGISIVSTTEDEDGIFHGSEGDLDDCYPEDSSDASSNSESSGNDWEDLPSAERARMFVQLSEKMENLTNNVPKKEDIVKSLSRSFEGLSSPTALTLPRSPKSPILLKSSSSTDVRIIHLPQAGVPIIKKLNATTQCIIKQPKPTRTYINNGSFFPSRTTPVSQAGAAQTMAATIAKTNSTSPTPYYRMPTKISGSQIVNNLSYKSSPSKPSSHQNAWTEVYMQPWDEPPLPYPHPLFSIKLHQEILDFVSDVGDRTYPHVQNCHQVIGLIKSVVKRLWPNAELDIYGSFMTGLWLPSSDVDIVVNYGKNMSIGPKNAQFLLDFTTYLNVSDPFAPGKNVAAGSFNFGRVKAAFQYAFVTLSNASMKESFENEAILSKIMMPPDNNSNGGNEHPMDMGTNTTKRRNIKDCSSLDTNERQEFDWRSRAQRDKDTSLCHQPLPQRVSENASFKSRGNTLVSHQTSSWSQQTYFEREDIRN
eukprot:gene15049-17807_t